ncbi:MAG: hypothetical protein KBG47_13675 [Bacteroidia bacterium]|nr:hypothetical protein [Sphingobacteriaceae bacterium]MBK7309328.1 hypothetical protein [Sphingobacteriaceae bacterium]MBK7818980.1 hypothetical protein [Sphingobacteriaceae bacterium]MBP9070556.1 hypothetical protein [Bacteroidia bacterium]
MKTNTKFLFLILMMGMSLLSFSQDFSKIKLDPEKVKKFEIFLIASHGNDIPSFQQWKESNKYDYVKQMWYFSESFYIKRNVKAEGISMDETGLDISRFEKNRKATEEAIVEVPGYKDVIVLLPADKLFYKP